MQVIIDSTAKCVNQAAERFSALLRRKPDAVLGLATGSTPEALYGKLIEQYKAGIISFKKVTTSNKRMCLTGCIPHLKMQRIMIK